MNGQVELCLPQEPIPFEAIQCAPDHLRQQLFWFKGLLQSFKLKSNYQIEGLGTDYRGRSQKLDGTIGGNRIDSRKYEPVFVSYEVPFELNLSLAQRLYQMRGREFVSPEEEQRWNDIQQGMVNLLQLQREATQGTVNWDNLKMFEAARGPEYKISDYRPDYRASMTLSPVRHRILLQHGEAPSSKEVEDGEVSTIFSQMGFDKGAVQTQDGREEFYRLEFTIDRLFWQPSAQGFIPHEAKGRQRLLQVKFNPNDPFNLRLFSGGEKPFLNTYQRALLTQLNGHDLVPFVGTHKRK